MSAFLNAAHMPPPAPLQRPAPTRREVREDRAASAKDGGRALGPALEEAAAEAAVDTDLVARAGGGKRKDLKDTPPKDAMDGAA